MKFPDYFKAMNYPQMVRDYPLGDAFVKRIATMSRDELRTLQNKRFLRLMQRGWQIPFYRRLWAKKGLKPDDIRSLDDISLLPTFSKSDLMESIEAYPPFGDFHGMDSFRPEERPPIVMATTSGTTGKPQPLYYGPRGREIHNLILARAYFMQGLRPDDVVHSVYGHGMINGGHFVREVFLHFTNCIFLSAGTGIETRSRRQVELMRDFGVTVLVGFADYLRHLADVSRDMDIIPGRDIRMRMICTHLGPESREAMSKAWAGAEVFEWHGIADTGTIAAEGPDHAGLYVMEDAHYLQIIDPETHEQVPDGETGNMCVTALYKDDFHPVIRFNMHDVSAIETTASPLGWNLRRTRGFLGRSDNMIKLRGINIFPTAIGAVLQGFPDTNGEYVCRVDRNDGRDDLTVLVEVKTDKSRYPGLRDSLKALLKERIGVATEVELVPPGDLASITGLELRQKAVRLIDNRYK